CIDVNRSTKPRARRGIIINGNVCLNSEGAGISVSGGVVADDETAKGYIISNNVVRLPTTRGIHLSDVDGALIQGNSIEGSQGIGIFVDGVKRRLSISNNEIFVTSLTSVYVGSNMSSAFVSIQGNIIDQSGSIGIAVESASSISVKGN